MCLKKHFPGKAVYEGFGLPYPIRLKTTNAGAWGCSRLEMALCVSHPGRMFRRVQMRQHVEAEQRVPLGRENKFGNSAVSDSKIEFDNSFWWGTKDMSDRGGNRPPAGYQQNIAFAVLAHMIECASDAGKKIKP